MIWRGNRCIFVDRITDKSLEDFFKETGARLKGKNVNAAQHFSINLSW